MTFHKSKKTSTEINKNQFEISHFPNNVAKKPHVVRNDNLNSHKILSLNTALLRGN